MIKLKEMTINDMQTEDRIFEAATEVFEEKGLSGARMQQIADKAGINKALLHYYFRTKDHLFDAVFSKVANKLIMKFNPIMDEKLTLEEKIRFFFTEHITFLQKNPRLPAFVLNEINHNPERILKFIIKMDIHAYWKNILDQHKYELHKYNITEETLPQILTTIVSISIFPFAAKGVVETILNQMGVTFNEFLDKRKDFAAEFVINAIKKCPEETK
ncbi:MAG TPA: TetR/AcrR family transcriptional regulator [Bacteroidales bacterium]|nr:TetR/AcrR family transcriptional regulator [Bacteroidales bacterium]